MTESACLPDSNVWIALMFDSHPGHQAASDAIAALTDSKPAVFCRATQQSFLRLITTPALSRHYGVAEINNDQAIKLLETFFSVTRGGVPRRTARNFQNLAAACRTTHGGASRLDGCLLGGVRDNGRPEIHHP